MQYKKRNSTESCVYELLNKNTNEHGNISGMVLTEELKKFEGYNFLKNEKRRIWKLISKDTWISRNWKSRNS